MRTDQLFMFVYPRDVAGSYGSIDASFVAESHMCGLYDEDEPCECHMCVGGAPITMLDVMESKREDFYDESYGLDTSIASEGVSRPILLAFQDDLHVSESFGLDVNVWDGNHRFTAAYDEQLYVPVQWINDRDEASRSWRSRWEGSE